MDDTTFNERLRRFADQHRAGELTDAEYADAKNALLSDGTLHRSRPGNPRPFSGGYGRTSTGRNVTTHPTPARRGCRPGDPPAGRCHRVVATL